MSETRGIKPLKNYKSCEKQFLSIQLGSLIKKVSLPTIVCGLKAYLQCHRKPHSAYSYVCSRSTQSLRKASPRPK